MRAHGAASQRLAFSHSRPITNITQAQIRSTQSTSGMSSHQSLAHTVVLPKSPVMSTGYSTSLLQGTANDDSKSQSLPCGISVHQVYHNTQAAVKETLPLANKSSPKSTRKHPLSEKISKRVMMGDDCESSHNNCVRSSDQLQSIMSTNANITPPNVVIGATGGLCQDLTIIKDKQEKKRDKERLSISIMKKISAGLPMRVRKSKSPIPDGGKDGGSCSSCHHPSSDADMLPSSSSPSSSALTKPTVSSSTQIHHHTHHHSRSGSAPGCSPSRAAASGISSHKKSSSVDVTQHNCGKSGKVKSLVRERYQCIVPYPPQSDIELELKLGDIVYVHKKREDGWYKGILQSSGKMGLFPGSFVEKA
ncbi:hypothetical protein LSH36_38g06046 [Paralvinella palmiformis]|uniref:RING-type E3 ubiquitin transferase n=1 Tax=Paralvinella palmiformis TaxID=53620 RepID=A0AAD9K884_9ANNE|nr:hypothetical protein LSH36_38g06046 [Paralvinella palmiformis]